MTQSKLSWLAFSIFILGASFYMYEFTLQVSLGVMTSELMRDLSLNAASLGIVGAFYYYAYMPMQIPAGVLHDRFGPRIVLTVAILICALGALFFSLSKTTGEAAIGRFLMGVGSAFSFTGALLLISRWFSPTQFPILSGFVQLMSSIGAIVGELPLAIAIRHWEWRPTMFYLFCIGVILAALVLLVVRNFPPHVTNPFQKNATVHAEVKLREVFARFQSWSVAFYSFLIWAPIAAFAVLWGIPFLTMHYQISTEAASIACTAIWIGIGVGCPTIGWVSEYIKKRCIVLIACGAIGIFATVAIIYFVLPMWLLYFCLFLFGWAGSGQSLAFSVVRDSTKPQVMGAALGLNNMATVAGGAILQPIIGACLQINWDGMMVNNVPYYSAQNYQSVLIILPVCYCLAVIISAFFIKETYGQERLIMHPA